MRLKKDTRELSIYVFRKLDRRQYEGYFMIKSAKIYCIDSIDIGYAIVQEHKRFYI